MKALFVLFGIGAMLIGVSSPASAGFSGKNQSANSYTCKSGHLVRNKKACKEFGGHW